MPAAASSRPELLDRALDVALAALAPRVEQPGEVAERLGLQDLEAEVLELPLDLPDPEPLGQRRVDLHRLAGDALLLLGLEVAERAHVVQPVGELDQHDADVVRHREEHLPDVLGLLLLVGVGREPRQLGDAVDEVRDLGPEALLDVREAVLRVLRDVVEQRGGDGDGVDAELREDLRRRDRVGDVGLARRPDLGRVGLHGEVEGALDDPEVRLRVVLLELGQEPRAEPGEVGRRDGAAACARRSGPCRSPRPRGSRGGRRHAAPRVPRWAARDRGRRARPCAENTPCPVRPRTRPSVRPSPGGRSRGRPTGAGRRPG